MTKKKLSDVIFDVFVYGCVAIALVVTLYPFLYVVSMSISDPEAVIKKEVFLFPKGFSLTAFRVVLKEPTIWRSYYNTLWYTAVGTSFNLAFTVMAAYPLSKRSFFARNFFIAVFVLTMFFTGGMIPRFILIIKIGLFDPRWALIFPTLINNWNLIICRTFFQTLPEDLFESARIEGCGEWRILWKIALPLSKPIVAVLTLFYGYGTGTASFRPCCTCPDPNCIQYRYTCEESSSWHLLRRGGLLTRESSARESWP